MKTYQDEFKAVHPMLTALRSGNPEAIEKFGDLKMPDIDNKMIQAFEGELAVQQDNKEESEVADEQREKANKLLKVAIELGLERDIAVPLIETEIVKNPNLSVAHIIHRLTTIMVGAAEPETKKRISKKPVISDWQRYPSTDMRNMYFQKGETTMHTTLLQ